MKLLTRKNIELSVELDYAFIYHYCYIDFYFLFLTYSPMLIAHLISTTTRFTPSKYPHPALLIIVNVASIITSIIYQEFLFPQFKINMGHRSFNQRFRSLNHPDS